MDSIQYGFSCKNCKNQGEVFNAPNSQFMQAQLTALISTMEIAKQKFCIVLNNITKS